MQYSSAYDNLYHTTVEIDCKIIEKNMDQAFFQKKIEELKSRITVGALSSEQETEIEYWFLCDFFLYPVEQMIEEEEKIPMELLHMMQQVVRGVYPYWIDNDRLYALGREKLETLSLIGRDFSSQEQLDAYGKEHLCHENKGNSAICHWIAEQKPPVSVILPTYNRASELGKSMQSVLDQTYENLELIVVSDGSTDETEQVVKGFTDQRVRFVRSDKNGGLAYARNLGIHEAQFELLAFHDDDDLWREEKLEKQIKALTEASMQTGFCYCEMEYHRLHQEENLFVPRRDIPMLRKNGFIYPELLRRNFIGGPTLLVWKECLADVGYFDERLAIFEDWDMVLRLSKSYDAAFVAEPLYDYFEHEKSLTTDRSNTHRDRIAQTLRLLDEKTAADKAAYGFTETYFDTYMGE